LLAHVLREHKVSQKYRILLMYDNIGLMRQDADKIYRALTAEKETKKPIALVIHSGGGEVDAGYLISKLCREFSPDRFLAVVPRRAKSAATLICCGADEIHMGSMSELGPIDPQRRYASARFKKCRPAPAGSRGPVP
jgi:ClpP class serine protease